MDVWFVAAAAGAGYVAQRLKNIKLSKNKMLSSEDHNLVEKDARAVPSNIQDKRCQYIEVLSRENHGDCNCVEEGPAGQDASGGECQGELTKDSTLRRIEANWGGRVSLDDTTSDLLPQPSTREIGFIYDFRRKKNSISSRRRNRQFIKPRTSLESCLMAQLFEESAKIEENFNSVHRSNRPTTWPLLVADESLLISREPCESFNSKEWKCKLLKETHLQENAVLGVPRLPNVVSMKLKKNAKTKTQNNHTWRRSSCSTVVNGNHEIAQGSCDGALPFYFGLTMGIVLSFLENKKEVEKLNKLLKHKENLVQDLQEELEMKDSLTVKELAVEDYESQDECCDRTAEEESLSKIEAELEAELVRLESNINSTRLERKLSNVTELDTDFLSDATEWELNVDLFDAKEDTQPYKDRRQISPPSAQYPISPRELSLRLHEVIQSRLEERINELESALENSQRKNLTRTSSSHNSPVCGADQKSVVLNLSGENLAAYDEACEEKRKVPKFDYENFPFQFQKRNDHLERVDKWKEVAEMVQNGSSNDYLECSNGYVETLLNLENVKSFDNMNDYLCESRDESEDGEKEMERLLIRQIVEKARQGFPVVSNARMALLSSEQNSYEESKEK